MEHRGRKNAVTTNTLLACGVIAGPLFVIAFVVEGATRANYNALRHPVSSLALGDAGWMQIANFIVAGLLMLAFAFGLQRVLQQLGGSRWEPGLIAVWAVGLIGAGIFLSDPVSGYPPGTPDQIQIQNRTIQGALHDLLSVAGFTALSAACFLFGRRFAKRKQHGWAVFSAATGMVLLGGFVLASVGFSQAEGFVDLAGLFQRTAVTVGWTWLTVLAVHLRRVDSETREQSLT
jgi:Kef-type K+ transport system membrane component KefB